MDTALYYTIGQIHKDTKLGKEITRISEKPDVETFVDIGTWNGLGSTKCIYDSILNNKKRKWNVYSYEVNNLYFNKAISNLAPPLPNFNLIYGSIISYDEAITLKEKFGHINEFYDELGFIKSAPYVYEGLPKNIDLTILDGGEYTGFLEFMKLWERSRFIILDDTKTNKHPITREFILDNPSKFKIIFDDLSDRNGTLSCERI